MPRPYQPQRRSLSVSRAGSSKDKNALVSVKVRWSVNISCSESSWSLDQLLKRTLIPWFHFDPGRKCFYTQRVWDYPLLHACPSLVLIFYFFQASWVSLHSVDLGPTHTSNNESSSSFHYFTQYHLPWFGIPALPFSLEDTRLGQALWHTRPAGASSQQWIRSLQF